MRRQRGQPLFYHGASGGRRERASRGDVREIFGLQVELVCVALDTGHDASLMANEMQKQSKASRSHLANFRV